jgi:hypothetical protein
MIKKRTLACFLLMFRFVLMTRLLLRVDFAWTLNYYFALQHSVFPG